MGKAGVASRRSGGGVQGKLAQKARKRKAPFAVGQGAKGCGTRKFQRVSRVDSLAAEGGEVDDIVWGDGFEWVAGFAPGG